MKKLFILLAFASTVVASAQSVAINTDGSAANASAILDLTTTTKGLLPPRMISTQRDAISLPAAGLQIVCTNCGTSGEMQVYNGTSWTNMIGGVASAPTYFPVTSSTTKIWIDRNLGATRAAISSTDTNSYGDLYQWGRDSDGHQIRTSSTTSSLSSTDVPGTSSFITVSVTPFDWRSGQNNSLWQGVNGINNPCPSGYRLPTSTELDAERAIFSNQNSAGAFASVLKLPVAGSREYTGALNNGGTNGNYWTSTITGISAQYLNFGSISPSISTDSRARGFSVRCLKD